MCNEKEILKKNYEIRDEYVLEALEEKIDEIYDELSSYIPKEIKGKFDKFIEVTSYISDVRLQLAYKNGQDYGFKTAKKMLLEVLIKYEF